MPLKGLGITVALVEIVEHRLLQMPHNGVAAGSVRPHTSAAPDNLQIAANDRSREAAGASWGKVSHLGSQGARKIQDRISTLITQ